MRQVRRLLLATLLVVPTGWAFAAPANACADDVCAVINTVCRTVVKKDCLR